VRDALSCGAEFDASETLRHIEQRRASSAPSKKDRHQVDD
jgi:hypothetical protein